MSDVNVLPVRFQTVPLDNVYLFAGTGREFSVGELGNRVGIKYDYYTTYRVPTGWTLVGDGVDSCVMVHTCDPTYLSLSAAVHYAEKLAKKDRAHRIVICDDFRDDYEVINNPRNEVLTQFLRNYDYGGGFEPKSKALVKLLEKYEDADQQSQAA